MAILPIRIFPDAVLRQPTEQVSSFDAEIKKLLNDMAETMYAAPGIGLAAPQVGVPRRVAVVDVSQEKTERIDLVNPRVVWTDGSHSSEEGCLSIPGYYDTLKRHAAVVVEAQDLEGKEFELKAEGLLACCLQHEIDHLDGILFVDRLSRLKKELFRRWVKKQGVLTRDSLDENQ